MLAALSRGAGGRRRPAISTVRILIRVDKPVACDLHPYRHDPRRFSDAPGRAAGLPASSARWRGLTGRARRKPGATTKTDPVQRGAQACAPNGSRPPPYRWIVTPTTVVRPSGGLRLSRSNCP
jgi:hypothetical protein